uniref:Gustatory receptor n=1 Tax=viral metagenome TaxID=1070528 RepID=A0A6C0BF09_9ZZZZ
MACFGKILNFIGYTFNFNDKSQIPPLDIETSKNNTYVAKIKTQQTESTVKKVFIYIYNIIIICIIMIQVPYAVYMSIKNKSVIDIGRTLFQFVILLQYYYGKKYFSNNHFYENIVCDKSLMNTMKIFAYIFVVVSIILSFINTYLLGTGHYIHVYTEVFNMSPNLSTQIVIYLLLFFNCIYSYIIFTVNACIFSINLVYHKNTVATYSTMLDDYIKNSMSTLKKLNIITIEYSQMKFKYENTVDLLTLLFSSLNFFGFSAIYFYINAFNLGSISAVEIINIIMFLIIDGIYLYAIMSVSSNILHISHIILSNNIIATLFETKRTVQTMPIHNKTLMSENKENNNDFYISNIYDLTRNIMISSISTEQMVDWLILQKIVKDPWKTFTIFGIQIDNTALLSRLLGIIISVLISIKIYNI